MIATQTAIRLTHLGVPSGRFTFSSNSGTAQSAEDGDYFQPNDDWSNEVPIVEAESPGRFDTSVAVFPVGTDLVEQFRSQLPILLNPTETTSELRSSILLQMAANVTDRIAGLGIEVLELRVSNVAVNRPGTRSTGKDFQTNRRVGLHIDNHDRLLLANRSDAVRLLALNCGSEDRYFLFLDLPVSGLLEHMGMNPFSGPEDPRRASDDLKTAFLRDHSGYPVKRVRIPPGCAYIATPQDLIHDGAGSSATAPDIAFLMLGRYRFRGETP